MTEQSNTIVQFPYTPPSQHTPTLSEIEQHRKNMQIMHIEEVISIILPSIFNQCMAGGITFGLDSEVDVEEYAPEEDYFFKDVTLVAESLRSLLMKYYNLDHPLQTVAEAMITISESGEYILAKHVEAAAANGVVFETK